MTDFDNELSILETGIINTISSKSIDVLLSYKKAGSFIGRRANDPVLWYLLGELSKKSWERHKFMISAVVVNSSHIPGAGFFALATDLGLGKVGDAFVFDQMRRVWSYYKSK